MANDPIVYDLVLMLSMGSDDDARAKIVSDVEAAIGAAGGRMSRNQNWGRRPTTYRIRHEAEAEYHLIQFSGPTSLLESLSHTLGIADEVLRFRIIKVLPGTPEAPASAPPVLAGATAGAPAPTEPDSAA
jgi:small subunit ribosomal protein S6